MTTQADMSAQIHHSGTADFANSVGKIELAQLLGWSRPRLDKRLETDAAFPVLRRKRGPGGYQFDPQAVATYLGVTLPSAAEIARKNGEFPPDERRLGSIAIPPTAGAAVSTPVLRNSEELAGGARHAGEATARQRRDQAQAAMLEDKLKRQRSELMDRAEVDMVVGTAFSHLAKGLDGLADMVVKKLGLPEETADSIRALTDDLRVKLVNDLRTLFEDGA